MHLDEDALEHLHKTLLITSVVGAKFVKQLVADNLIRPQTKIYIYKEDNHKRPHIHVYFGKQEQVSMCIATGDVLAGEMKQKFIREVQKWIIENQQDLLENWMAIQNGSKPELRWVSNQ